MRFVKVTTLLSTIKNPPERGFGAYYNFNLYRGCQHGCIYCDSRSECYNLGDLSDIRAKENSLELLDKELTRKKIKGTITTGSMNDPYMPVEKELQLTRRALKIIQKYNYGVHIITKSDLVTRDIDILTELKYAAVSITITSILNSKKIEPGAPETAKRFIALKKLIDAGIYAGVSLMPILPYITDSKENILGIIQKAKECGAKYILCCFGVTLRDNCRGYFYSKISESIKKKYEQKYGTRFYCYVEDELINFIESECKKVDIPMKMKFYYPTKEVQKTLNFF
ncbi:radical SAM protein [Candidatus Woesearchaeota archaeon]|nr:radical SAM protein [Candidatus Woesearchaeota archaeon]